MRRLAELLLVVTLLQGTSVTLSFAVRLDASGRAAALLTFAWLLSYVLAAWLLCWQDGVRRVEWLVRFRLPLVLLALGTFASCLWSIDRVLSLERGVHFVGSTLVAVAIGFTLPLWRTLQISRIVLAGVMIGCVAVSLALPVIGLEDYEGRIVWRGMMASKNTLGFWAAIAALLFGLQSLQEPSLARRAGWAVLCGISLLCLWQSVSATSMLALLVALIAIAWAWTSARLQLGALASLLLGLGAVLSAAVVMRSIDTAELIGRSGDLTGRGALWQQTRALIAERPWGGFGYGTIWQPTESSRWIQESLLDLQWVAYHAHNGLLQVASELGLPLSALTIAFAVQQLIEIVHTHYRSRMPETLFVLGFCIALLVSNYSEARLLVNRELYWIWFVALPLALIRQGPEAAIRTLPVTSVWRRSHGVAGRRLEPAVRRALAQRRRARQLRSDLKLRLVNEAGRERTDGAPGGVMGDTTSDALGDPTGSNRPGSRGLCHPPHDDPTATRETHRDACASRTDSPGST